MQIRPGREIHRSNLSGRPSCGAVSGRVSSTGIDAFVSCAACKATLSREDAMRLIEEAAAAFRASR